VDGNNLAQVRFLGSIPGKGKRHFSSRKGRDGQWDPLSLPYNGYRGFPPGVKRQGREAHHQPPPVTHVP
jgi:hypothetical protein